MATITEEFAENLLEQIISFTEDHYGKAEPIDVEHAVRHIATMLHIQWTYDGENFHFHSGAHQP